MADATPQSRSLRDPAARKLPARYAESELDDTHSKNSAGDSSSSSKNSRPPPSTSGGDVSSRVRSDSPVAPGPPPGYTPPAPSGTVKRKGVVKSAAVTDMLASSTKSGPSPSSPPSPSRSSPPAPIAPGPPLSRVTTAAASRTSSVAGTPDVTEEQLNSSSAEDQEPRKKSTVAAKRAAEQNKEAQSEDEQSSNVVPKTSIIIPKNSASSRPPPRPFVPQAEPSGRVRADRDVDFFTLRKVARGIETNPPPRPSVTLDLSTSDDDFDPASASKDSAQKDADDSEEEVIVDLTGSSPSSVASPLKAVKGKNKVVNSNKQVKSIPKAASSTSKKQKGKAPTKASTTARSSAPPARPTATTPTTPVASSSRVRLPARQSPEKTKEKSASTSPEKSTTTGSVTLTPEEALKRARTAWTKAHTEAAAKAKCESAGLAYTPPSNPASPFYLYYYEPYLKQNPDPRYDNVGIALDCRCCAEHPYTAWRILEGTSTSLLKSHVNTKKVQGNLEAAKAKGGISGPIEKYLVSTKKEPISAAPPLSAMQARQISVAWVTARARPISIMDDEEFIEWLPEDRRGLVPHRNTITKDIGRTFLGMQDVVRKQLAAVEGAIHLAMDIWTSPNGHSFIGVVGCWQEMGKPVRHVLEMVPIMNRHTAKNVATEITMLMKRLDIERKVWFIASDSASVNTAMMKILGDDERLPLIEGEPTQIRCMAHVLNLISEAIIRPFNQAVRDVKEKGVTEEDDWATDEEVREDFDADEIEEEGGEEDRAFSANLHPSDAYDEQDDQLIRRALRDKGVAYVGNEDEPESPSSSTSSAPPVPTAELRADSGAVGLQIRQLAWFARKLRYNTPLRVSFQTTCALFKLPTPHSLIRDVATRWNSTFEMIERGLVLWDAIVTWQEHNVKLIPAKFRIKRSHKSSFEMLIKLLQPLKNATSQFSTDSKPTIADIVGTYEDLDDHYRKIEDDEDYSETWREAARRAGAVCSTYYGLADNCRVFYLAVILHPNLRVSGMRSLRWEEEWIEKAEETLRNIFEDRYRCEENEPESQTQSQNPESAKAADTPKSFLLQRLEQEQAAAQDAPDPIAQWIAGTTPVKNKLVNPLQWWWKQKQMGMMWSGLTALALDVFSAPATSVDVERLFSKAGRHITPLRHRLKAIRLGHMVTLGGWFREGWVPRDCLGIYLNEERDKKLAEKAKGKRRAEEEDHANEPDSTSKRRRIVDDTDEEDDA